MASESELKMGLTRRDFLRGLVGVAGVSILAACAPQATSVPDAEEPAEAPAAAEPTKISYWTFWADRWGEFQGTIVEGFNESQSEIEVEMLIAPWGELNTKLLTAIPAGNPPDFTIVGRGDVIDFAVRSGIMSLNDRISGDDRVKADDWFDVAWTECQWEGKTYGLPFETGTYAYWLNKDIFEEVGLDPETPPVTWDDVDVAMEKITIGDATAGYERLGVIPWDPRVDIIGWVAGGKWYDEENKKVTAVTEPNIAAFTWFKQYADKYGGEAIERFAQGLGGGDTEDDAFLRGKLGMVNKGSWSLSAKYEYAPDLNFDVFATPYRPGATNRTIGQGSGCVLPKGSPNPDAAFKFLVWMSIDGVAEWVPFAADMVSRKDQMDIYPDALPDTDEGHKFWATYNDALAYAYHEPLMPVRSFWGAELNAARDNVVLAGMDPEEALQIAQDNTQKELDKALESVESL